MDGEQCKNCDAEYQSGGKWLSRESQFGQSSGRKGRRRSKRTAILRQKKLPRHWRENDDSLLTELDLLQPSTHATKQSSLLSYMSVGSAIPKDERKSITDHLSVSNSDQDAAMLSGKEMEVKRESGSEFMYLSSEQDGFIRKENSSKEQPQEVDCFKDERLKHKPDARLFVPVMINVKKTKSDHCDTAYSPEVKEVGILSLRKRAEKVKDNEIKTEMRKGSKNSFVQNDETIEQRFCCSQSSLSEDEYSDEPYHSHKNHKDLKNQGCTIVQKDSHLSVRHHHAPFSEENLSFSQTEDNSQHVCLTLNESQKVQKEVYKAQMGTLEFSDFTSDI